MSKLLAKLKSMVKKEFIYGVYEAQGPPLVMLVTYVNHGRVTPTKEEWVIISP
jgi:hypothetical protein